MDKRSFTCCFTGHRNLPIGQEEEIWKRVYARLDLLLEEGVRYFGVGGALGFDTLVAEKLLALRERTADLLNAILCCKRVRTNASQKTTETSPFLTWLVSVFFV